MHNVWVDVEYSGKKFKRYVTAERKLVKMMEEWSENETNKLNMKMHECRVAT